MHPSTYLSLLVFFPSISSVMSTGIHHHVLRSVSLSIHPCICPSLCSSSHPSIYLAIHEFIWTWTLLAIFRSSDPCVHLSFHLPVVPKIQPSTVKASKALQITSISAVLCITSSLPAVQCAVAKAKQAPFFFTWTRTCNICRTPPAVNGTMPTRKRFRVALRKSMQTSRPSSIVWPRCAGLITSYSKSRPAASTAGSATGVNSCKQKTSCSEIISRTSERNGCICKLKLATEISATSWLMSVLLSASPAASSSAGTST